MNVKNSKIDQVKSTCYRYTSHHDRVPGGGGGGGGNGSSKLDTLRDKWTRNPQHKCVAYVAYVTDVAYVAYVAYVAAVADVGDVADVADVS